MQLPYPTPISKWYGLRQFWTALPRSLGVALYDAAPRLTAPMTLSHSTRIYTQ